MLSADGAGIGVVSHAGAVVVLRAVEKTGLTSRLSDELAPWRKPLASHDPARSSLIWPCPWRSAGIGWLTSTNCMPTRRCSGRWRPIRRRHYDPLIVDYPLRCAVVNASEIDEACMRPTDDSVRSRSRATSARDRPTQRPSPQRQPLNSSVKDLLTLRDLRVILSSILSPSGSAVDQNHDTSHEQSVASCFRSTCNPLETRARD